MKCPGFLLASADFDGTLQLLTSGWGPALGYAREELKGKSLLHLMWSDRLGAAAAVAAVLDRLNTRPVELRLRCRGGLAKSFRLYRRYDKHEDMMYLVAEETPGCRTRVVRARTERRAAVAA